MTYDPNTKATRELIQRWIGSKQTGDLNDPGTVSELLKDVTGLQSYLQEKLEASRPAPVVDEFKEAPGKFADYFHNSPNRGGKIHPKGVVFHHSAGSFQGTLSWCLSKDSQVSYNLLFHPDGSRHWMVPPDVKAWHAGKSSFRGKSFCNGFMVGAAFSGTTYERKLTPQEIASAREFVRIYKDRFGWTFGWMTDHRTVSPRRKNDLFASEFERLLKHIKKEF